jgi:hypothetical protein
MKLSTHLVLWGYLDSIVFASPLQVDVNVHIDTHDATSTYGVKGTPICQLATSTSSSGLPVVTLGYELHRASPEKVPYFAHLPWVSTDRSEGG